MYDAGGKKTEGPERLPCPRPLIHTQHLPKLSKKYLQKLCIKSNAALGSSSGQEIMFYVGQARKGLEEKFEQRNPEKHGGGGLQAEERWSKGLK